MRSPRRKKLFLDTYRQRKKGTSLTVRHGLLLIFGIGTFVALMFMLVYYVWYLPIQKSMQ